MSTNNAIYKALDTTLKQRFVFCYVHYIFDHINFYTAHIQMNVT